MNSKERPIQALASLLMVVVAIDVSGCSWLRDCPANETDARSEAFLAGLGPDDVVGLGLVQRFVDTETAGSRGYDLDVQVTWHGEASGVSTFLQASDPVAGISPGDRVIVIARSTDSSVLVPGACTPLIKADATDGD